MLGDPPSRFEIQPCKQCRMYPFVRSQECAQLAQGRAQCHNKCGVMEEYAPALMGAPPTYTDNGKYYYSWKRADAPECPSCARQLVQGASCTSCSGCNL